MRLKPHFNPLHATLQIIPQPDNPCPRRADLCHVDVGAGEAVEGREGRGHGYAVGVEDGAEGAEVEFEVVFVAD